MYKIVFPWSSCSSCIHLVVLLHFACGMWFLVKWIEHFVTRFCWRGYTICMCPLEHLLKGSWHPLKYNNLGFIPLSTILCSKVRPSRSWGLDWKLCRSVKILSAHLQQIHTLRFCKWQKTAIETKTHRTIVQSISHPFFCNSRTCSSSTETIWRVNCNPANLLQLQHYRRRYKDMKKHTPLRYQRLAGSHQEHPKAFHDAFGCSGCVIYLPDASSQICWGFR